MFAKIALQCRIAPKENPIKMWINRIGKFRQEKSFQLFRIYDVRSLIFEI